MKSILQENLRRNEALTPPNPLEPNGIDPSVRMRTDFAFWAASCVRIRHKTKGQIVPFILNRPQREVLAALERQRTAGKPLRLIVLKSRQWGCSTFALYYTAWLQLYHFPNANSIIAAHVRDAAITIRSFYHDLIENYENNENPENPENPEFSFSRFRGLSSTFIFQPANARVSICTAQNPDAVRGADFSIAHLSEVAFWPDTARRPASNLVRSVCSSIPRVPNSMVIMESTANGAGGFFYEEWQRADQGESDKAAVFAPWYLCEYNAEPLTQPAEEFYASLNDYERSLWQRGATLEQILWYRNRLRESGSRVVMQREHPTTPAEAFCNSLPPVFEQKYLDEQQRFISAPRSEQDGLQIWSEPCAKEDLKVSGGYIAAVDVGGNWEGADWSVVAVFDCRTPGRMELAAQWRGHVDIDHLCTIAADLGHRYHDALLVVESNSMEARGGDAIERLAEKYRNLYRRRCLDTVTGREDVHYGFHTNRQTKAAAMSDLIAALRDGAFIERSSVALSEMATYVRTPRGNTEATTGCHDDLVMTRAIAAYALRQNPPRPRKPFFPQNNPD